MGHPHPDKSLIINNQKAVPDTLKIEFSVCPKKWDRLMYN